MFSIIDHIVYCVPDLEESIAFFENTVGVKPVIGGKHSNEGTHNAILNLGGQSYLEILAVDKSNDKVSSPLWMGVDHIKEPQVTRWCIKSDGMKDQAKILKTYDSSLGEISSCVRLLPNGKSLNWQMTRPSRIDLQVNIIPFLIDWSASFRHPTDDLPIHIQLLDIALYTNSDRSPVPTLQALDCNIPVHMIPNGQKIKIRIEGPKGQFDI